MMRLLVCVESMFWLSRYVEPIYLISTAFSPFFLSLISSLQFLMVANSHISFLKSVTQNEERERDLYVVATSLSPTLIQKRP